MTARESKEIKPEMGKDETRIYNIPPEDNIYREGKLWYRFEDNDIKVNEKKSKT